MFDPLYRMIRLHRAMLAYDIAEGFLIETEDGGLHHSTPELLGIDDSIFEGLEEVIEGINNL